jgi:general secretion pathway protein N
MSSLKQFRSFFAVLAALVTGVCITLLVDTPDTWIAGLAKQLSGQRLQLTHIEGGLIQGSADFYWGDDNASTLPLGRWEWRYSPGWDGLLTETISALLGPATGQVALQVSWDGVTLHNADFIIQVSTIKWHHPLWMMVQPSAELHFQAQKINIQNEGITGEASLTCSHGYSPQVRLPDLGSWQIQWKSEDTIGILKLVTLKGPLHVDGDGQFSMQPLQLKLSGRLWSEARYARDLEPIIKSIGPQQVDGSVPWKLRF